MAADQIFGQFMRPLARVTVTVKHPNGREITKAIDLDGKVFGEINWRTVEEHQMRAEMIAAQHGAGPEQREKFAEIGKREATHMVRQQRCDLLTDALTRMAYMIADEMVALESDGYSEWNHPKPRGAS